MKNKYMVWTIERSTSNTGVPFEDLTKAREYFDGITLNYCHHCKKTGMCHHGDRIIRKEIHLLVESEDYNAAQSIKFIKKLGREA